MPSERHIKKGFMCYSMKMLSPYDESYISKGICINWVIFGVLIVITWLKYNQLIVTNSS
jgi:hypothetical protein